MFQSVCLAAFVIYHKAPCLQSVPATPKRRVDPIVDTLTILSMALIAGMSLSSSRSTSCADGRLELADTDVQPLDFSFEIDTTP